MNPNPPAAATAAPARRRRRLLAALAAVGAVALALWLWWPGLPLAPVERDLVGKWTIPIGANPPPNAVRTVYHLAPNRSLTVLSIPVAGDDDITSRSGGWRVERDVLVMDATTEDGRPIGERLLNVVGMSSSKLFGNAPPPSRMQARFRILETNEAFLRLEDEPGSDFKLVRSQD